MVFIVESSHTDDDFLSVFKLVRRDDNFVWWLGEQGLEANCPTELQVWIVFNRLDCLQFDRTIWVIVICIGSNT